MHSEPFELVCPDDLKSLDCKLGHLQCTHCSRNFPPVCGIMELLPRESADASSIEQAQLLRYASTFSNRPDKLWLWPLRVLLANLGNGYLYRWAARTVEQLAEGRPRSILDAACGDGMARRFLSKRHSYVGIDFSTRLLLRAQRHVPASYY